MEDKKIRLDILVSNKFNISRTIAKEYILQNFVSLNEEILNKPNLKLDELSDIELKIIEKEKLIEDLIPWNFPIEIVYEDDYIFIVNKPSGILVHPTNFKETKTLSNIMKHIFISKNIKPFGDYLRSGIVHRLDKDTSGLLIVAKDQDVYNTFVNLIKNKKIKRKYKALVHGYLNTKKVEVDAPISRINETNKREVSKDFNAQDARTIFSEIKRYKNFSLIDCELITGRTHQIRVHAKFINNNIINDPMYGLTHLNKATKYGQYLFAYNLIFEHPFIQGKLVDVKIDMPHEFNKYIENNGE